MAKMLFRKAALDRLASPEQLDQMVRVISPKSWIWLATIAVLLAMALMWGIWGRILVKVMGRGLLIKTGGISQVSPLASGQLLEVKVSEGDIVYKGQVVARIAQPALREKIRLAREAVSDLENQRDEIVEASDAESKLKQEDFRARRKNIENTISGARDRIKWLDEQIVNQAQLLKSGLITERALVSTKDNRLAAADEVDRQKNLLQQLDVEVHADGAQRKQQVTKLKLQIKSERRNIVQLREQLELDSKVVTPHTGRIVEVMEDEGVVVAAGSPIMRLEKIGNDIKSLEVIVYLSPADGKKVRQGMKMQIAPSTVNVGEHGFILAIVTHVSEYPATAEGMMRVLGNQQLVKSLSQGGAPIAIQADLIPDPGTVSGYKWSSAEGPPIGIFSGTMCGATVVVDEQPPISLVIPLFRKWILGESGDVGG